MSSRWNSLIVKIMIVFFLVILPLYGLSVSLTYNSSGQMREEIERSNESVLYFYYSNFQLELARMTNLMSQYTIDAELSGFSTLAPIMTPYSISERFNSILLKLQQMKASSPYIEDVQYYIPSLGKRVSAADGVTDSPSGEWQSLIESQGSLRGAISAYNGELYLIKSTPAIFTTTTEPSFVLAMKLSSAQMVKQLRSINDEESGGAYLSFGSEHSVVISDGSAADARIALPNMREGDYGKLVRQATKDHHIYSVSNEPYQFQFVSYISNDVLYKPMRHYSYWMWGLTGVSCLIIIIFSYWILRLLHRPLASLIRAFRSLERGDVSRVIEHRRTDEFGYLYSQFNKMTERLHDLIEDNYLQRIHTQEAQLKHLQSQITPHFLYNSLFTVKQMAEIEDVEGIKTFSDYLGKYFRYMTRDFEREVTLKQELEHSLVYLHIQEIRFSNRMTCDIAPIPARYLSLEVPRVILQPIFENVFEHGLDRKPAGGVVRLRCRTEERLLILIVEDNGERLTEDMLRQMQQQLLLTANLQQVNETTGLLNVHHRLRIRFGADYGLQLSRSELGGLQVEIRLPLRDQGEG